MSDKKTIWNIYQNIRSISDGINGFDGDEYLEDHSHRVSTDLLPSDAGRYHSVSGLLISAGVSDHMSEETGEISFEHSRDRLEEMAEDVFALGKNPGGKHISRNHMVEYGQLYSEVVEQLDIDVKKPSMMVYMPKSGDDIYTEIDRFLEDLAAEL
ncbi:MAG: hypothetical protein ABEJ99_01845 [Candidatus Nanohaloarchaea archaeon]